MYKSVDRNKYKLYQDMENQKFLSEMPMTQRLEEINGQLERSIVKKNMENMDKYDSKKGKYSAMQWTAGNITNPSQVLRSANYGRYYSRKAHY